MAAAAAATVAAATTGAMGSSSAMTSRDLPATTALPVVAPSDANYVVARLRLPCGRGGARPRCRLAAVAAAREAASPAVSAVTVLAASVAAMAVQESCRPKCSRAMVQRPPAARAVAPSRWR